MQFARIARATRLQPSKGLSQGSIQQDLLVNPYHYLAATRILACALILPLLTLACDASGNLMGWRQHGEKSLARVTDQSKR